MSSARSTGTATDDIGTDIVTGTAIATGTAIGNGAAIGIAGTPGVMAAVSWFAADERLDKNRNSGVLPGLPASGGPDIANKFPRPSRHAELFFDP